MALGPLNGRTIEEEEVRTPCWLTPPRGGRPPPEFISVCLSVCPSVCVYRSIYPVKWSFPSNDAPSSSGRLKTSYTYAKVEKWWVTNRPTCQKPKENIAFAHIRFVRILKKWTNCSVACRFWPFWNDKTIGFVWVFEGNIKSAKTLGKRKHLRNDSKSLEKHEVSHCRNPYENCGFCTSVKMWKSPKVLDGAKRLQDKGWRGLVPCGTFCEHPFSQKRWFCLGKFNVSEKVEENGCSQHVPDGRNPRKT